MECEAIRFSFRYGLGRIYLRFINRRGDFGNYCEIKASALTTMDEAAIPMLHHFPTL